MKRKYGIFCLIAAGTLSASATTVWLENGGKEKITTGDGLDKIKSSAKTIPVVEIPGLNITARTLSETQEINALSESFGVIDKSNPEDDRSCIEGTETVLLSFDQAVRISGIDFNHFDQGESFTIQIGETQQVITHADLANKNSDLFKCDIPVPAGTEIQLSVTDATAKIGLDALEIETMDSVAGASQEESLPKTELLGKLLNRD